MSCYSKQTLHGFTYLLSSAKFPSKICLLRSFQGGMRVCCAGTGGQTPWLLRASSRGKAGSSKVQLWKRKGGSSRQGQGGGVQSKFWGLSSVARPGPSSDPGGTLPKQHKIPQNVVTSQGFQGCQHCQGFAAMDSLLWWELCSECRAG